MMLRIHDLSATVADEPVLKRIPLGIDAGEAQKLPGIKLEGSAR